MNIHAAHINELVQIDLLKQINTNLCADIDSLQLRESMFEYRSKIYKILFDTHPEPTALIRLSDGHLLEANQRFEKLLGYTEDEFRAVGIKRFFENDIERIRKIAKEALKNGRWFQVECNLLSRDEIPIPVAISASLIKHDDQTLIQASLRRL
ncbi:PAS domain-containing protein [bacterium]|nr:PAS domain-containing protein [bacterium]MBU4058055.1 PAS domain-containing protein [bacterium]MBU4110570.1 PAS domain-containing protein [bacterium]